MRYLGKAVPYSAGEPGEIEGDLDDDQRRRLMEIADRCPVHHTLERGAQVRTQKVCTFEALQGVEDASQHARGMTTDMVTSAPAASEP